MTDKRYNELISIVLENNAILKRLDAHINKEELSPDEVCQLVGISRSTYQRKVDAGIIPQMKKGNARNSPTYVKRMDIENLQAEGKI